MNFHNLFLEGWYFECVAIYFHAGFLFSTSWRTQSRGTSHPLTLAYRDFLNGIPGTRRDVPTYLVCAPGTGTRTPATLHRDNEQEGSLHNKMLQKNRIEKYTIHTNPFRRSWEVFPLFYDRMNQTPTIEHVKGEVPSNLVIWPIEIKFQKKAFWPVPLADSKPSWWW